MSEFIVYPAIDLRDGKVVRLKQGQGDVQTVYGDDPEQAAQEWIEQGAEWLHVVNLNGALDEQTSLSEAAIRQIAQAAEGKAKVQLGGGVRTMKNIESMLALGISRVILGTAVIENPEFGVEALAQFGGEQIVLGVDVLGDKLMSRGWQSESEWSMMAFSEKMVAAGAKTAIFTSILKDGMQTGVDWEKAKLLADETGLEVIAAGGVAALNDIAYVRWAGLAGIVIGRALYEGNFTLTEALNVR